jgi:superoxide reductase
MSRVCSLKKGGIKMAVTKYSCEQDILCGVRVPKDLSALSELEQKHLPVISAPERVKRNEVFEVTVEVGKYKVHPNEPGHFIEWIELYCGDTFLFRVNFSGSLSEPKITIPVKLTHAHGPLKAWEKCNLHGLWEDIKDIAVED